MKLHTPIIESYVTHLVSNHCEITFGTRRIRDTNEKQRNERNHTLFLIVVIVNFLFVLIEKMSKISSIYAIKIEIRSIEIIHSK